MKNRAFLKFWIPAGLVALLAVVFIGCSPTVSRQEVRQHQASFTATGQDSGILDEKTNQPVFGFKVNQDWINGYDALLDKYGDKLSPARKKGDRDGITREGDYWRISDAVMERQLVMNQRRVDDQAP